MLWHLFSWVTLNKSSAFAFPICQNAVSILSCLGCVRKKGNPCRAHRGWEDQKHPWRGAWHTAGLSNAGNSEAGYIVKILEGPKKSNAREPVK